MCSEPEVFCFGEHVHYLSRQSNEWIPAVVQGHVMVGQTRYYNLDVQDSADPSRVISQEQYKAKVYGRFPSSAFPGDSRERIFCFGEEVRYLSRSTGQWIPAVVQGHVMIGQELHYQLDVQEAAHPSRIKPALDLAMAPTVPVLSEVGELERSTAVPTIQESAAREAAAAPVAGERQSTSEVLPEDSVCPLRIASPAPRPKAIASQQSLRPKEILEAAGDKDAKEQDMTAAVLERVERPSDLFSQKTFLDEPNITLSSPIFGDMLSLSLSLPFDQTQQVAAAECGVAQERVSDLFSRKTFLDEPHFGLATCDSLEDGSPGQSQRTGARCT